MDLIIHFNFALNFRDKTVKIYVRIQLKVTSNCIQSDLLRFLKSNPEEYYSSCCIGFKNNK